MALKRANQPFHFTRVDGVDVFVDKGDLFDSDDEATQGRDVLFDTIDPRKSASVIGTRIVVEVPDLPAATPEEAVNGNPADFITDAAHADDTDPAQEG